MQIERHDTWPPPAIITPAPGEYRNYCTCGHSGYSHCEVGCCCCICRSWQLDPDRPADRI